MFILAYLLNKRTVLREELLGNWDCYEGNTLGKAYMSKL